MDPPDRAVRGEVDEDLAGEAVPSNVTDAPEQLRAAETPTAPPLGPRKNVSYRKPK